MSEQLGGKVAIVTGGASGIGRGIVELFVGEGAKVLIADVNPERGEALATRSGPSVLFKRTDVANADDIQALVDMAVSKFGGLHIMVNNAGISGAFCSRFLDDELADFHKIMGVNLLGVMVGSQRAARHMAKNGGGSIINIASSAATMAGFGVMTYRASKAGVLQFSKAIAIDLAEYGIRVNCIAPSRIATDMAVFSAPDMAPDVVERVKNAIAPVQMSNQPLKRQGTPQDVAEAAVFLGSDKSAQITGVVLPVDGGTTAGDAVNRFEQVMAARARALASESS
jgi:NAD(P)-dependent dehydrogenase (short-subunit alcohol dehydrogenase family)